jgi:fatty-acyl-CoA synthase
MEGIYGDIFEAVAAAVPDRPVQVFGDTVHTWHDLDRRANALAADLLAAGLTEQSKVAAYLYNDPAYLETYVASFKAGLVPFNTNYRYGPHEITYLFDNADAEAVVFHASFAPLLEEIRAELPLVKRWYVVADGETEPDWAVDYESVVAPGADRVVGPWGRSEDHILMIYTGGTTGMPKGVMWPQRDLFAVLGAGGNPVLGQPPADDLDHIAQRARESDPIPQLPGCPLMHGTGQFSAFVNLTGGGSLVLNPDRHLVASELWDLVEKHSVASMVIVGDAFGRPLLAALREEPDRWDLSSLAVIVSSGVMWSQEVKDGLLEHLPTTLLYDSYGSSEAVGLGASLSSAGQAEQTATFQLGERVKVFTEDGRPVEPGSDETGFVAIAGAGPSGYYKDPEKTAQTWRVIDGVRYGVPGDHAKVNADGTLQLLGRGSVCINTGGEKVFPEEVEEVLKQHDSVEDAVCVGIPHERFGESICAVVEPSAQSAGTVDDESVIEHVKAELAHYKAPRDVVVVDTIGRAPNGKVDYSRLQDKAREVLGR